MKFTWAFLCVSLVVLAAVTSGASIDHETSKPEMRQWYNIFQQGLDKLKETWNNIRDRIRNGLNRLRDFFTNTKDKFDQTNAKAQQCYETFKKQLKDSVDTNAYQNQEQYASFVDNVVESASADNITEFEKNVTNLPKQPTFQSVGRDLQKIIKRVRELVAARVKCTLDAYKDTVNGARGNNSAVTSTEGNNNIEDTTTINDNIAEVTSVAENTANSAEEVTTVADNTANNAEEVTTAADNTANNAEEVTTAADNTANNAEEATIPGDNAVTEENVS